MVDCTYEPNFANDVRHERYDQPNLFTNLDAAQSMWLDDLCLFKRSESIGVLHHLKVRAANLPIARRLSTSTAQTREEVRLAKTRLVKHPPGVVLLLWQRTECEYGILTFVQA